MFQSRNKLIRRRMNIIYEQILKKSKEIEQQIKLTRSKIERLPEGKLICTRNGKYFKWVLSVNQKRMYLPKSERALAEKLAYKKFLLFQLKNLEHEKMALDFYLRHHNKEATLSEIKMLNSPGYQELISPFFQPISQELQKWQNEPYQKNKKHPENLIHKTHSGNIVRSKSETIIDMILSKYQIPFRYECGLQLGDTIIYPDFTVRHPRTGAIYYWDHFGIMDDLNYSKNTISKLQLYTSNGIIPSIQLITTYETKDNPLTTELVEKIVKHYFL